MIIKDAKYSDLDQIVKLHKRTLKTVSASLGDEYLRRNYLQIMSDSKTNIYLVALENQRIIGVLTASLDLNHTLKTLSGYRIIEKLLFNPLLLYEFINHAYFEYKLLHSYSSPYQTILTLFVSEDYQGMGVGSKLVKRLVRRLKSKKVNKLYVDTLANNKIAQSFYNKIGFKEEKQITNSIVLCLKFGNKK